MWLEESKKLTEFKTDEPGLAIKDILFYIPKLTAFSLIKLGYSDEKIRKVKPKEFIVIPYLKINHSLHNILLTYGSHLIRSGFELKTRILFTLLYDYIQMFKVFIII